MTYYVGIDPATSCGYAVLNDAGERIVSGTWKLERRRGDGAGFLYVRFERLFRELLYTYRSPIDLAPIVVCYEQQANRFAGSAHVGLGIIAHIQRICEELQIPYSGVAYSVVKKTGTGRGNANKTAMMEAAQARWNWPVVDDNDADALFIAEAARQGLV